MQEEKIIRSFSKVKQDISFLTNEISNLKKEIQNNNITIAKLEGMIIGLMKSQPVSVSQSLNKSQNKIETKIIKTIRRNKKQTVVNQIKKLMPLYSVIEIKNMIVDEKGLCSKASFYRYISSLIVSKQTETETKLRL